MTRSSYLISKVILFAALNATCSGYFISNDTPLLTPEQWTERNTCVVADGQEAQHDCKREPSSWRYNYVNELRRERFVPLVSESSFEERLANLLYFRQAVSGIDIQVYKFKSGNTLDDELNIQQVAGSQVDDRLCTLHLRSMYDQIEEFTAKLKQGKKVNQTLEDKEIRLVRVLESFGRYDTNYLSGKALSFGSHQQCIQTQLLLDSSSGSGADKSQQQQQKQMQLVESRYCWAKLNLEKHLSASLREREPFPSEASPSALLPVAICLPSTCHSRNFKQNRHLLERIVKSQFKLPDSIYYEQTLELDSIFCLVDEDSPKAQWTFGGKLFVSCFIAWILLTLFVTFVGRYFGSKDEKGSLLACLDLGVSWNDFVGQDERHQHLGDRLVDLDVLNFVKIFCSWIILIGHSVLTNDAIYSNLLAISPMMERARVDLLQSLYPLAVDAYFVTSSLLLTYLSLRKINKYDCKQSPDLEKTSLISHDTKPKSAKMSLLRFWPGIALLRYTRLTPLLFLLAWFKKSVYMHTGSGPLWDYGLNAETPLGACLKEPWWVPLTPMQAFLHPNRQCIPPGWSIANDILYNCLVVPPIIWLLYKRPKLYPLIMVGLIYAHLKATAQVYATLPAGFRWELEDFNYCIILQFLSIASQIHTLPQCKMAAFIIGPAAGYLLFKWHVDGERQEPQQRRNKSNDKDSLVAPKDTNWLWSFKVLQYISTGLTLAIMVGQCFGDYIQRMTEPEQRESASLSGFTWNHIIFSVSYACLILRMMTDWRNNSLMRFFSNKLWKVMSKLNYAIMLVHWEVLVYDINTAQTDLMYSRLNNFKTSCYAYILSLLFGTFIYVVIESPLDKVIRNRLLPKIN